MISIAKMMILSEGTLCVRCTLSILYDSFNACCNVQDSLFTKWNPEDLQPDWQFWIFWVVVVLGLPNRYRQRCEEQV